MDHMLTSEQVQFADNLTRWLARQHDFARWRAMDPGSAGCWPAFAEMGWLGLLIPEEHEGIGQGLRDMAILAEAFGGALVRDPWMSTALLGAGLIDVFGTADHRGQMLPAIAEGRLRLALALAEPEQRFDPLPRTTRATTAAGGTVVQGQKILVLDAPLADRLLVTARAEDGALQLLLVDPAAVGVQMTPYTTVDDRMAADIRFNNARAEVLAAAVDPVAFDAVLDRARLYLCAEGLGAMRALLRMTLEYVQNRRQFGQAIGEFQVIRHRIVDMRVALEVASALTADAIAAAEDTPATAPALIAAARVQVGLAAQQIGRAAVQLHGGMGMTDELAVGHYFKRLLMVETLFGDIDANRRRFMSLTA